MNKKNNEVIELEAEEIEPVKIIENHIHNELVKNNVTDQVISKLRADYMHLAIKDENDREGYNEVKAGRMVCKGTRVLAEKICKKGREAAVLEQKMWIAKEKEVAGKISEVEDYLEKQEKEYEAKREAIKQKRLAEEAERLKVRTSELRAFGAEFDGANYVLDDVSFTQAEVRELDDDIYQKQIVGPFKALWEQKEAIRVAEENKQAEIKAEQARQEAELKKREEELMQKQAEIEKAEREARERQEKLEEQARQEKLRIQKELQAKRFNEVMPFASHVESGVDLQALWVLADSHFEQVATRAKNSFDAFQKEQEAIREKKAEEEKQRAVQQAIADAEARQKAEQAKAQQEKEFAEARSKQELEQSGDRAQWQHFISQAKALTVPIMKSGIYRNKAAIAIEKLEEIIKL